MDFKEYQQLALRTAKKDRTNQEVLINASMGLNGEAGEVIDLIKKHIFHEHELNKEALIKEMGDVLWYLADLSDALDITLEDVAIQNIEKLKARYPEGFDINRSKHRENVRNDYFNSDELLKEYYDTAWGIPCFDEHMICEMVILESFSCGLSWLIVLKKKEAFEKAFDNFDLEKIANYDEDKIVSLCQNPDIIRAKGKIKATIKNAKVMLEIKKEFGSMKDYLWSYVDYKPIRIVEPITTNELSDTIAKDLKKRGITYFGSVTIYSFLQAIGIINSREEQDL